MAKQDSNNEITFIDFSDGLAEKLNKIIAISQAIQAAGFSDESGITIEPHSLWELGRMIEEEAKLGRELNQQWSTQRLPSHKLSAQEASHGE